MTALTPTEIERRALAILEELSDQPDDPNSLSTLLENEDPAVIARVLKITAITGRAGAMPTELPGTTEGEGLPPPVRFGAFRFVSLIGRGGMGEVWLGRRDDGLYDQAVAIKLIQPHLQARAGEAFESERRMLARFEHPHIARLIDGGRADDGRACIVMEYVDGEAFDAASVPLALIPRIALFGQVLDAVSYAHRRLVAHGDLKPSNILVDREGRVRLLDFGIARLVTEDASDLRLTGAVTSSFASPARLAGEPPTIADDVFALGRLLETSLGDDGDVELVAIARKASAPNEADRYDAVADLQADLRRWTERRPVSAMLRTFPYIVRKYVGRNAKWIAAVAVIIAALVYAGSTILQTQRERLEASERFEDARGAAHYLLFPLYDQLAGRPRTLLLRREVAVTAHHYLDRLAHSRSAMGGVRLEAAQGLLRLSQIEGSPYLPNLGQPELAKPNLEAALAMVRDLDSIAAYKIAAQVELELANNADMVEEDDPSALRHLVAAKAWIGRIPSPDRLMLAQFYTIGSTIAQWQGDAAAAVRRAKQAQRLLATDNSLPALLRKSTAAELEGDGTYLSDKIGSIRQYRQSMIFAQQAVRDYPGNYAARRRFAITHYDVGTMLTLFGDPSGGLALLQQASEEDRDLLRFEPDDDNLKRAFAIVERARAIALAGNGQIAQGLTLMGGLVADTRRIWIAHPYEYRRMRDYAVFEMGLANLQLKYDHTREACASYRRSQMIFDRMEKDGHLSAIDRKTQLGGIIRSRRDHCAA